MNCLELQIPPLPQFVTVGHSIWLPGMQHFRRTFPVYDLIILVQGRFYISEDDQSYELAAGGIIILEPGKTHWGHRPVEEPTEIYWIHFTHHAPLRTINHQHISWTSQLPKGTDADTSAPLQQMYLPKYSHVKLKPILPVLQEMVAIHQQLTVRQAIRLHHLMVHFLQWLQFSIQPEFLPRSYYLSEQIVEFLFAHFTEPITAKQLEQHFHFDYLARCLKKHSGMSPIQYIHFLRLERSQYLLTHSERDLEWIAEQVGFSSAHYLSRVFVKKFGMTPSKYREMYRINEKKTI